jgi:hypothetical protein
MILMSSQKNVRYYYPLKLQNPDLGTEEERRGEERRSLKFTSFPIFTLF